MQKLSQNPSEFIYIKNNADLRKIPPIFVNPIVNMISGLNLSLREIGGTLYIAGSVCRGTFLEKLSDIDILIVSETLPDVERCASIRSLIFHYMSPIADCVRRVDVSFHKVNQDDLTSCSRTVFILQTDSIKLLGLGHTPARAMNMERRKLFETINPRNKSNRGSLNPVFSSLLDDRLGAYAAIKFLIRLMNAASVLQGFPYSTIPHRIGLIAAKSKPEIALARSGINDSLKKIVNQLDLDSENKQKLIDVKKYLESIVYE